MNRRFWWAVLALTAGPYIGTLAWTGTIRGEEIFEEQREDLGAYRILLDRGSGSYYINMEEYLPGVVAMQMPVSYESEALRVQAIIARTYIRRQMEASGTFQSEAAVGETGVSQPEAAPAEGVSRPEPVREIAESALDLDYMEQEQLRRLWGTSEFPQYYQKLEQAVKSTEGMVLTYEGSLIDPMFFRLSAGMTREGDFLHPYFQNVDCPEDMEADGFVELKTFSGDEAAAAVNSIPQGETGPRQVSAGDLPDQTQIISRDQAGYVEEIQIGNYMYTGEEIQYAFGLSSSCFSLESYEGGVRFTVKGSGHGYGLSQNTANEKAKEGWTAEDILAYFYKNVLISE